MKKVFKSLCLVLAALAIFASCTPESTEKKIISFQFAQPAVIATINEEAKTIEANVPWGTDLTTLVPVITISDKATISPASGTIVDFTNPVVFTVTAEDGSEAKYTATVTCGNGGGDIPAITKKIKTVYYSEQYGSYNSGRIPVLQWNWDNSNLLESVDVYDDDNVMMLRINFTYDESHRISRMDCFQYNLFLTYTYNESNNTLDKMDLYFKDNGVDLWVASCGFTYKEGKMYLLNVTIYNDDFVKKQNINFNLLLKPFLPEPLRDSFVTFFHNVAQQRNGNYVYNVTIELTWDGDNPSKLVGSGLGEMITATVQYDNKNFPVYGFFLGQYGSTSLFKNNPIQVTVTDTDGDSETGLATYQYDSDNYPTQMTMYEAGYSDERYSIYYEYY